MSEDDSALIDRFCDAVGLEVRDRATLGVLCATGVRVSELVGRGG